MVAGTGEDLGKRLKHGDVRVAIVLYKLASCAEYRVVVNQFGVHKTTMKTFVYSSTVIHSLIKVPTAHRFE